MKKTEICTILSVILTVFTLAMTVVNVIIYVTDRCEKRKSKAEPELELDDDWGRDNEPSEFEPKQIMRSAWVPPNRSRSAAHGLHQAERKPPKGVLHRWIIWKIAETQSGKGSG